jgi:hypothetical protein
MYKELYIYTQCIQGLCQSRLRTADHDLHFVAQATTAALPLERSYARPPSSLRVVSYTPRSLYSRGNSPVTY